MTANDAADMCRKTALDHGMPVKYTEAEITFNYKTGKRQFRLLNTKANIATKWYDEDEDEAKDLAINWLTQETT